MPYSRAPAARLGFTLDWFQAHHPDWVMYRCDRKTVAFWGAETAPHGSVPLDFTNADVIEWQMANQSSIAHRLGYSAMAFDNFGGGARQGANNGQACGVWQRNGSWTQVFQPVPKGDGALDFAEASVRWIEQAKERMAVHAPGLGIVPNLCIDRPSKGGIWTNSSIHGDWATSSAAQRVMAVSTGILSERGFSGWGAARAGAGELEDELRWMARLEAAGKGYFTINEVTEKEWSKEWVAWVLGCFLLGKQPHSVSIAVAFSRSLKQENAAFTIPDFCIFNRNSMELKLNVTLAGAVARHRTGIWKLVLLDPRALRSCRPATRRVHNHGRRAAAQLFPRAGACESDRRLSNAHIRPSAECDARRR